MLIVMLILSFPKYYIVYNILADLGTTDNP